MHNERVQHILNQLANGETREQIALQMGYKTFKSLDMYMRRRSFVWDMRRKTYYLPEMPKTAPPLTPPHAHVARVLSFFEQGWDAQTVAAHMGFATHRQLATYMRDQGYAWNGTTYVAACPPQEPVELPVMSDEELAQSGQPDPLQDFAPLLSWMHTNKDVLLTWFDRQESQVPRYLVPGVLLTKSVHMSHSLSQLAQAFSREHNVSQRDLFETALIEFFKRYGYAKEMDRLLRSTPTTRSM